MLIMSEKKKWPGIDLSGTSDETGELDELDLFTVPLSASCK